MFKLILINKVINQPVDLSKAIITATRSDLLQEKMVAMDVLRLDRIHPVVSGNKWFKLKYHIAAGAAGK